MSLRERIARAIHHANADGPQPPWFDDGRPTPGLTRTRRLVQADAVLDELQIGRIEWGIAQTRPDGGRDIIAAPLTEGEADDFIYEHPPEAYIVTRMVTEWEEVE